MKRWVIIGLLTSIGLAVFLSPFASQLPDGLERTAEVLRFLEKGEGREIIASPMPDYNIPFIKNEFVSTSFAGLCGVLLTFFAAFLIGILLKKR
jgi:cobalt/nickel transport protein